MIEKLSKWWNARTEHTHGRITMVASKTSFLWGMVKVYRYRAYLISDVDTVTLDTPHHTWRGISLGPIKLPFYLPKFIENRCE